MRLIDADELLSIVRSMTVVDKSVMHRILIQMPTVDAVPVVQCKDCIRYHTDDDVWGRCTVMPYRMRKNDYCSYGVIDDMRKDGKQNAGET